MAVPEEAAPPVIPDHRLFRIIGRGSYGEVWLAENIMGAGRAVKVVRRDTFDSARPYEREYSAIRRYEPVSRRADGLVQVLHAGRMDEAGLFYYVMELADSAPQETESGTGEPVPGESYRPRTLASDLKRLGRLPAGDCVSIALSLAGALAALHSAGLAHRDVKPSNIIFVNGRAKLADIGLVSELGDSRSFVGTEGYIPPEGPGTPSADLFSLGRVLYEAVTGLEQSRYPELPPDWITKDQEGVMEFFEVVLKACEGDPARRYQNGADMLSDLALLQGGRSVRRVRLLEARVVALKRWGLAALLLAALAAAGVGIAHWRTAQERKLREQQASLLYEQALASARAGVNSERPDARQAILDSARLAARALPGTRGPRDAAIAALARPGLSSAYEFKDTSGRIDGGGGPFFSADLQLVAEADSARRIHIRRVSDGRETAVLPEPLVEGWYNLDFSPDGKWISGEAKLNELRVWHLPDHAKSFTAARPGAPWILSSFAPDSRRLLIVWMDGTATLHDLNGGGALCEMSIPDVPLAQPGAAVSPFGACSAWAPDGGRVALGIRYNTSRPGSTTFERGKVLVFDTARGTILHRVELDSAMDAIDWSPQGDWLALAMSDHAIRRWQLTADKAEDWLQHDARALSVHFHPSGEWLVTSSWDSTTLIWNVAGQHPLMRLNGWGTGSRFSSDGTMLLHHDTDRRLRTLYRFQTTPLCRQLHLMPPPGHNPGHATLLDASLTTDGLLAVAGYDGLLLHQPGAISTLRHTGLEAQCVRYTDGRLWCGTREGLVARPTSAEGPGTPLPGTGGHHIHHVDTSRNGRSAIFCSIGQQVFAWQENKAEPLPQGTGYAHVAISPDGRWGAAGGRADVMQVWDLANRQPAFRFSGRGAWVHVAFSPDGTLLTCGDGEQLRAFEIPSFRLRWQTPHRDPGGFSVRPSFSPDGRLVAATLEMRQPWLIDAATGELIARLEHPFAQGVNVLAFSPDSRTLAALGTRNSIFLWDLVRLRAELDSLGLAW